MSIHIPKTIAGLLLLTALSATAGDLPGGGTPQVSPLKAYCPIGAAGNNVQNPQYNPVPNSPELALAPLNFGPGPGPGDPLVNAPNARTISNVISGGTGANGQNGETTDPVASAWLYVFGQFVDHDLDLEETPLTNPQINIEIPQPDPVFTTPGISIAMNRDSRSPTTNTIINTTAGYLDLSQLYGSDAATAASLRNADGTYKTSYGGTCLPIVGGAFVCGDPRVMENPELTALTILFMREHNYWVGILKGQHSGWSGDQLYYMAKAITTAEYQNIVYTEFLPTLVGPLPSYHGYDPGVNAQVTQEFSTAAFRIGHSQVSDTQEGIDNNGNTVFTQSLADSFFNTPAKDVSNGINPLLRSLGVDFAQATDVYAMSALRNLLFAGLVGGGIDEMDLIAIDIQREKDVGLGTLNQTRKALNMRPYHSFADLTPDRTLQKNLATVYGDINRVDLFIGGAAETHASSGGVGRTYFPGHYRRSVPGLKRRRSLLLAK